MLFKTNKTWLLISIKCDIFYICFRKHWSHCGPTNWFGITKDKVTTEWTDLANKVKIFYIGNDEMQIDKHFKNITDMLSDSVFSYGTDYTVR